MWPIKKKSASSTLPAEMQEYISAEKKERVGLAWLLAFATLVATLVLSVGVFYGGKWVYKATFKPNDSPNVAIKNTPPNNENSTVTKSTKSTQPEQAAGNPITATQNPDVIVEDVSSDDGVVDDGAVTVSAAAKPTALVNTGPVNTIKVFVLVSLFAAAGHNILIRRKIIS